MFLDKTFEVTLVVMRNSISLFYVFLNRLKRNMGEELMSFILFNVLFIKWQL